MPNAPLPKPTTPPPLTPPGTKPVSQPTSVPQTIPMPQQQAPLGQPQKPPIPLVQSMPGQVAQLPSVPARPSLQPSVVRPTTPLIAPSTAPVKAMGSTTLPATPPTIPLKTVAPTLQPASLSQQQAPLGQPPKPPAAQPVAASLINKPPTVAMGSSVPRNVPSVVSPALPPTTPPKPLASQPVVPSLANKQTPVPQKMPLASSPKPAGMATQLNQPNPATPNQFRVQQPPQTLTALSSMASNKLPTGALKNPGDATLATNTDGQLKKPAAQPVAPNAPSLGPQKPQAEFVEPKKSIFRFVPFAAGGVILLLLLAFVFLRFFGGSRNSVSTAPNQNGGNTSAGTTGGDPSAQTGTNPGGTGSTTANKQVTLEYWGLWEASETMTEIIKGFESQNPGVTVKYVKQSHKDYRTRLQSAINSGNGPDLYRFHASWVPLLKQELAPLPSAVMSASEYQSTFYPVAVQQLQNNGQLVGIPLMYDGLVLYYNTDIFKTAVVDPPKTWPDLRTLANRLTVKAEGKLTRSGIALGNATNVEHFADIIAVLILQNGGDLTKPNSAEVRDALLFYTNFVKTDSLWNDTLPSSTMAFARGEAAMMFAPSWRAHDVKAINPDLKFATVPLPQLSDKRITWASYWAEGVSAKSTHKDEAWKLIKYLSSKEVQQKLFAEQAKTRSFGELFSRKDLADQLAKDPVAASVLQDAGFAQGWYMSSFTHDTGVNDQIIQYYKDAVNGLLAGKSIEEVLGTLDLGVSQVLRQYAIVQGTGQTTVK